MVTKNNEKKIILCLLLFGITLVLSSCKRSEKTLAGAAIGAAAGAGIGAAIGDGTGAAVGAGVGALTGAAVGHSLGDDKE